MLIIDKHDVAPAILELINKLKITTLVLGAKNRYALLTTTRNVCDLLVSNMEHQYSCLIL
jgi:hypothetical protein